MQGNDLSDRPTPRYWVVAGAVMEVGQENIPNPWPIRLLKPTRMVVRLTPIASSLSEIWRFGNAHGVRMELLLVGPEETSRENEIVGILDSYANPFNDVVCYPDDSAVRADLAYRPDVVGIVDRPRRALRWGGIGLDIGGLR